MISRRLASLAWTLCLCPAASVRAAPPLPYRADYEHRISYAGLPAEVQALLHRVRADLYRIVLPATPPKPLTVRDAIEVVRQGHRTNRSPDAEGISISLRLPHGQTPESLPRVLLPARPYTVAEGFDRICAAADCLWTVNKFAITIVPRYDPP